MTTATRTDQDDATPRRGGRGTDRDDATPRRGGRGSDRDDATPRRGGRGTDRGALLLDAARRLIAGGGLGAVTHRSVESAAAVPHGSVTYYFGNRDGLLFALVDRMVAECEAQVAAIAEQQAAGSDLDTVARNIAAWMDHDRELHLARLELELAAARDPRLRERMTDAARVFWRMCEPLAAAAGSEHPDRDGRAMAAMVDGLLLDRLSHPGQTHDMLVEAVRRITAPVGG